MDDQQSNSLGTATPLVQQPAAAHTSLGATVSLLSVAIQTTRLIHQLPAIATLDWCDRAAEIINDCLGGGACAAGVVNLGLDGRVVELEAGGASISAALTVSPSLDTLRCRMQGLTSLGFPTDHGIFAASPSSAARLSDLVGRTPTRSPLAEIIAPLNPDAIFAWTRLSLSNAAARRWLICIASPSSENMLQSARLGLLGLVMDELGSPARRALGTNRLPRASWISQREREVLDLLVLGHSVREIAETMSRSPHTVHDHVKSLHRKLNAQSRGELVARALGHTSPEQPAPSTTTRTESTPLPTEPFATPGRLSEPKPVVLPIDGRATL